MAFGKKYYSSYKSNNNLDYYLEIFVEDFDSSATEISVGAGGPVISYETDQEDRFSPIISSQCVLPFVVKNTSLQAFIQQLRTTYKERQVYLHLYRATSSTYTTTKPIWSGFLVMDLGSGEDVSFPYEQKLTFVDGLSLLKDIDFVDLSNAGSETNIQGSYTQDNMYYGPAIYTFWIKEILAKAGVATTTQGVSIDYGFTTAVNWYNADMQNTNQGSDPLGLTQCVVSMFHNKNDQDVFTPENCYTVLKELLRHWGARITYWKHEFWIVQIPEYITDESGLIDNPDNINSRVYNRFGTLTGSQDHLGDTYYTRYEQTIQSNQVSKLVGTKYNYLPMIHNAEADFLSFASKNYYGGFPYGVSAESQEIFQGTIVDPSTANFLWLSVPLNWTWDMTGSSLTAGHENGWWCSVRFNFYASDGTTTYYLQYDSSGQGSYYWVLEADWAPLGNTSPKYIIKSRNLTETNYIGFQENIPFVDSSGSAIAMTGAWSFFLDIEDFANQSSSGNNGSFYCRFSGYAPSSHYSYVKKDPYQEFPYLPTTPDVSGGGPQTKSGTVRWSNTLENPSGVTTTSFSTPAGFDAGTSQADIQLITTSPFKGLLQTLNTTQSSSFGLSLNTQVNNSTNTEKFSFGTLLWGDAIQQFAVGCLRVNNGTAFVKTNPDGEWGRGTLTGTNTFTELLIDEFLSGQIKVVIAPTMRLAVGEENKNQTATGTGGPATRPRYVNPIGRLREFRSNETDPEYIFRRGSFHSLYDEWDYEGYQILRDTVSSTTTTTDIGDLGGTQDNKPISNAKIIGNVNNALMMNSPVAYLRTTVPATGSNVAVNGNFNTAVGWTLGTGWSIDTTAKKAKFAATGSTSELTQSVLTQGLTYQVNFQVVVTAGTLLVKAGTSGTSQSITTSGDYSLYLDCDGSNLIKFQAGTTFTGNITYITLRDQKSISAVPINSIGSTVFKSGDTFNLVNSLGGEILPLTVSSNQGATDDTISVTSTALFDDIGIDSVLLINQDDLSAQYQNKTKGTVAGFGIDDDGISKGGIEITGWLNSDTMSGAAVTNVPTALSVKNYVDGQVGASDTLAEVLANGNTTGGTDISVNDSDKITFGASADLEIYHDGSHSYISDNGAGNLIILADAALQFISNSVGRTWMNLISNGSVDIFYNGSKKFATTNTGISITGGGVFTDQVTIPATPVASTDAASKSYVDAQVSATDSLQEVTTIGNTTTNSVMIGSSTSPRAKLTIGGGGHIVGDDNFRIGANTTGDTPTTAIKFHETNGTQQFYCSNSEKMRLTSDGRLGIGTTSPDTYLQIEDLGSTNTEVDLQVTNTNGSARFGTQSGYSRIWTNNKLKYAVSETTHLWYNNTGTVSMKMDYTGNLLIGTTTDSGEKLRVEGNIRLNEKLKIYNSGTDYWGIQTDSNGKLEFDQNGTLRLEASSGEFDFKVPILGTTATFSGQVTIPATPVASTDAASKSYVDAQVGSADTLQEVTDNGASTTNNITIGGAYNTLYKNDGFTFTDNQDYNIISGSTKILDLHFNEQKFYISGSEKMRLNSTGLGIGTSSPATKLHINRSDNGELLRLQDTSNANQNYVFETESVGTFYGLNIKNNSTGLSLLNIGADQKIGIATNNPLSSLHVNKQAANTYQILIGTNSSGLGIGHDSSGQQRSIIGSAYGNAASMISFTLGGYTTSSDKMTILGSGNVGINTVSPTEKLHVVGDALITGDSHADAFKPAATGEPIKFKNFGSTEVARITDGGNLGIGTTSPLAKAHIREANAGSFTYDGNADTLIVESNANGGITVATAAANSGYIIFASPNDATSAEIKYDNSTNLMYVGTTYGGGGSLILQAGSGVEAMRILASGNCLIGTTTDSGDKLQVNGDVSLIADGDELKFGEYADLKINHDGTNSNITNLSGHLLLSNKADGKDIILSTDDGTGSITTYLKLDGSATKTLFYKNTEHQDNVKAEFGDSGDLDIYHDGSNSYIVNATGNLEITNSTNDGDIKFRCDNGSGGNATYITLDGSQTTINLEKTVLIGTTTNSGVYKLDVFGKARVQSVFELDDVLTLNQISTPADPASGQSSIYMDSADGAIKVKINVGGTVVTRTIASFE